MLLLSLKLGPLLIILNMFLLLWVIKKKFPVDAIHRSGGLAYFGSPNINMYVHMFSRNYIIFRVINNNFSSF